MMKFSQYIIILLLSICYLNIYAGERSSEEVRNIAHKHWEQRVAFRRRLTKSVDNINILSVNNNIYFVVTRLNADNNPIPGFIIISADTSMPEILAFDDNSMFRIDNIPSHIMDWMNEYDQLRSKEGQNCVSVDEWLLSSITNNEDVSPLLGEIKWDQGYPFNALCPKQGNERTPTGCVATALSQIMKYYKWPLHGNGFVDYYTKSNGFHISYDLENTYFEWEKLLDTYPSINVNSNYTHAIATLLSAVGASIMMDYDSAGSGANDYNTCYGMKHYMGYDSDMFVANAGEFSYELWHKTLQEELLHNRPVYYTGQSSQSGHAFVIDGMQKGDNGSMYYHINWGWGGLCNGYYLLNKLKPSDVGTGASLGSDFSNSNTMICGLMPEDNIQHNRMICKKIDIVSECYLPEQIMQICIESLVGTAENITVNVKLLLCDKNTPAHNYELYRIDNQTFNPTRKWRNHYISCYIPKDIPSGIYELRIECVKENNEEVEVLVDTPEITILDETDWYGGIDVLPKEYLGIRGNVTPIWSIDEAKLSIKIDSLINLGTNRNSGNLSFIITDTDGRMVSSMSEKTEVSIPGSSILRNAYMYGKFSRNIPDGYYWLCLGYRSLSDDKYTFIYNMSYEKSLWMSNLTLYSIPFRVSGGTIYIEGQEIQGQDIPWIQTDIKNIPQSKVPSNVYDINGIKLFNALPNHLYITNKKILYQFR